MSDIVERLLGFPGFATCMEAAEEITRLRAEVERINRLREDRRKRALACEAECTTLRAEVESYKAVAERAAHEAEQWRQSAIALRAEVERKDAVLNEALIKVENDRTMWSAEWLVWVQDARAALTSQEKQNEQ